ATVPVKVFRTPPNYRTGPSGLYNALLSDSDVVECRAQLSRDFDPSTDIWYVTDPVSAMDLPGRAIIRHADFIAARDLSSEHFRTSRPLRVHGLLRRAFETNGRAEIIQASFDAAAKWNRPELPACSPAVWTAKLSARETAGGESSK